MYHIGSPAVSTLWYRYYKLYIVWKRRVPASGRTVSGTRLAGHWTPCFFTSSTVFVSGRWTITINASRSTFYFLTPPRALRHNSPSSSAPFLKTTVWFCNFPCTENSCKLNLIVLFLTAISIGYNGVFLSVPVLRDWR